jgi:hypothetical protein
LSVTLVFFGTAWAQIPERNCMSNPFMTGCPAAYGLESDFAGAQTESRRRHGWRRPRLAKPLAADWPRWNFAQPDAGALIGMKLAALVQSPVLSALVGVDLGKKWLASAPLVDEVWVSIRPLPGQKTEAVMLLMGSAVESIAGDLRSKGVTVCFLDKRTLLGVIGTR